MNPMQLDRFTAFVDLARRTREAQNEYFRNGRTAEAMTAARRLERELDKAIAELSDDQPKLF